MSTKFDKEYKVVLYFEGGREAGLSVTAPDAPSASVIATDVMIDLGLVKESDVATKVEVKIV